MCMTAMANSTTFFNLDSHVATWQTHTRQYLSSRLGSIQIEYHRSTSVKYTADTWRPLLAARGRSLGRGYRRAPTFLAAVQRGSIPAAETAELAASELHSHNIASATDNDSDNVDAVYSGGHHASDFATPGLGNDDDLRGGESDQTSSMNGATPDGANANGAYEDGTTGGDEAIWERRREEKALRAKSGDKGEEGSEGVAMTPAQLAAEVEKRRNFAIISHPDAGKTTLTEKLLLYGGAIHEAGTVKARRAARSATSDWMELEKQRGRRRQLAVQVWRMMGVPVVCRHLHHVHCHGV